MRFPKPKRTKPYTVTLTLETIHIVEQYAKYCNMSVDDVIEFMLNQLIEDKHFIETIYKKRDNKKMLEILENF